VIARAPEALLAYARTGKQGSRADTSAAMAAPDWLELCRNSATPATGNDFLIPSYLLTDDLPPDPMEAVLAGLANERPTFWSEPIAEECAQIRELRDNAANQGRDSWWPSLGVLAYCEDGDHFAHAWGCAHAKYSFDDTQRELDGWRHKADGATLCETFERRKPGLCDKCPHRGTIKSPISLGLRWPDQLTTADARPAASPTTPMAAAKEPKNVEAPPPTPHIEGSSDNGIVRGDELLSTTAPPRRWFVEKFIPAGETTMLGGDGGSGKTTLGLQLCVASVSGGKWIGLNVTPRKVLYVSAEDPTGEIHFRLEQITKHAKPSKEELASFVLFDLAARTQQLPLLTGTDGLSQHSFFLR
jgi:AAA domain